jgi:hypothetical protein
MNNRKRMELLNSGKYKIISILEKIEYWEGQKAKAEYHIQRLKQKLT